jgi:hypothetical protein
MLHDGQFAHAGHVQIARRANLPQVVALVQNPKSGATFAPSRFGKRGVSRTSGNAGRDAMDVAASSDERCQCGRRRRVVLAPLGWCQARDDAFGNRAGDGD